MSIKNILFRLNPKPNTTKKPDPRQQDLLDRRQNLDKKINTIYQEQRRLTVATGVNPDPLASTLESRRSLNELRIDKLRSERDKFSTNRGQDRYKK